MSVAPAWPGHHTTRLANPVWCDPVDLLRSSRLDIIVKYLYFRSRLERRDQDVASDLYRRHIARRTGGYEGTKRRIDDYTAAADRLLRALEQRGFDSAHAVPIGPAGRPHDGAHRIAACLALGRQVAVRPEADDGPRWDDGWFAERGFSRDELDLIVRTYADLSPHAAAFIFWGAVGGHWPALMERLDAEDRIVGWKDVHLEPADVPNIVRDVYAYQLGPRNNDRIEKKGRALATAWPAMRIVVFDGGDRAAALKAELRAIAGRDAGDYFSTVHATDSVREARYIASLFFSESSLRMLPYRRDREDRPVFVEWLARYRDALVRHRIDPDDACIVGSGVLEAAGIREATDIDCVVGDGVRRARFHAGVVVLGEGVDLVTAGYHRRADEGPAASDAELIADPRRHFRLRGLKFANPDIVIDRKRQHGRPKDRADVALWEARTQHTRSPASSPGSRIVLWTGAAIDAVGQARLTRLAAQCLECGCELIVAGPVPTPSLVQFACIEGLPALDSLPDDLCGDPDPLDTLGGLGVDAAEILAVESRASGEPRDSSHAFRRLSALAWSARWMDRWLRDLHPERVVVESRADSATWLLRRCAVAAGIEVAVLDDAGDLFPMPALNTTRPANTEGRAVQDVCRDATMVARLWRRAGRVGAAERRCAELERELAESRARLAAAEAEAELRRIVTASTRDVWIWGAGAAGIAARAWIARAGLAPRGFIDSDASKHGTRVAGLPVESPATIIEQTPRRVAPAIVIASMHAAQIVEAIEARAGCGADVDYLVAPPQVLQVARLA